MSGWIKIYREIQDNWIWKDPVKLKWWIDMLLTVNHSTTKVNIGMQIYECKRGQSIMSLGSWAKRWNTSKDKVRNFFVLLEKDTMILHESYTKFTRITICNYDSYQIDLHDRATTNSQQTHTNNNDKEYNKEIISKDIKEKRKIFKKPNIEELQNYILEKGYSVDANRFFNYYESKGWCIGKSPMKNWRAAVRTWQSNSSNKDTLVLKDNSIDKFKNDKTW